jgi:hypothetical protein
VAVIDVLLNRLKDEQHRQRDPGRDDREVKLAAARRDPDGSVHPDRGRGREALDARVGPHDGARTQKPDAGHDLRRDATRISRARVGQLD